MCMVSAHDACDCVVHIVDALDPKRNVRKLLQGNEHAAFVSVWLKHIFYDLHRTLLDQCELLSCIYSNAPPFC